MSEKPSYLSLINAIAVGEARSHRYLEVWIRTTTDPDVEAVLRTVAAREGEHAMSFARRVDELGFTVRVREDPKEAEEIAMAASERSDIEKLEYFGLQRTGDKGGVLDFFDDIFKDHTIDIQTGELLGRYIAEEFDTARLVRRCYDELCARQPVVAPVG